MVNNDLLLVIIDTNLWISFLIGKQLGGLKELIVESKIKPVFSEQIFNEIQIVSERPKLQKYFPANKVRELIHFLKAVGVVIEIQSTVTACRDQKDNFLLALAKDSNADFLITGDQDLLMLENFEGTAIVTYQTFLGIAFSNNNQN